MRLPYPILVFSDTLWSHFHRRDNDFWEERRTRLMLPLLVFDQFEELFTLGKDDPEINSFFVELGDLIEGRPPESLRTEIDKDPDLADAFTFRRHHYKVLLSLREDFLPDLEVHRKAIPSLIHNRMRLKQINGVAAKQVVAHAKYIIKPAVAEGVVYFVAAAEKSRPLDDLALDPALLSLFCRETQ